MIPRSSTGIINLYSSSSLNISRTKSQDINTLPMIKPDPIKSLEHLTTSISAIDFHPSGEIMVGASTGKRDALKLVSHVSGQGFVKKEEKS